MKTNYLLIFFIFFLFGKNTEAQITAPFLESFDSTTFSSNWSQTASVGGPWVLKDFLGYAGSNILDHTGTAGSTRAWMDFSSTDDSVILQLDTVDVSALTVPELSFWFNCNLGTYIVSPLNILYVEINNGSSWVVLDSIQQDNKGVWSEHFYDITTYTFGVSKFLVRFRAESGGHSGDYYQDIAIDDISINEMPTCRGVTKLTAFDLRAFTASLTWQGDSASDSLYLVEWGTLGFSLGSGTTVTSPNDTVMISSLSPNTDYSFYVKTICKNGDSSTFTGPYSFKTLCITDTVTHLRDFSTWPPACWDLTGGTEDWKQYTFSGNLALANFWSIGTSNDMIMTTIPVHIKNDPARVRFYWSHLYSTSYPGDSLRVDVKIDTATSWETIWGKAGANLDSKDGAKNTSPGTFVEELIDLDTSKYLNTNVMVRFVGVSGFGPDLYIDTIAIEEIPPCPKAKNIINYATYTDSVSLTWESNKKNTSWILEMDTTGFSLGTGVVSICTNDSITITGLTPGTVYDVYLRSVCAASGDSSSVIGPFMFETKCIADTIRYEMDFLSWPPKCWDLSDGDNDWLSYTGTAAEANFWAVASGEYIMKSVPVHITEPSRIKFYWSHFYNLSYSLDTLNVEVKIDTATTWTTVWRKGGMDLDSKDGASNVSPGTYKKEIIFLDSATYVNKNIEVRFVAISGYGPDLFIDNVVIEKNPTCPEGDSLMLDSTTKTSAALKWKNGSKDVSWVFEYGPVGFTKGTGTSFLTSSSPGLLTGLTPATCYQVYVRGICSAGDTSDYIGPVNFCTKCNPVTDFCEYFETTVAQEIPTCWNKNILSTGSTSIGVSTFGAYTGSNHIVMSAGNDASSTLMLVSPELSTLSSGTHRINFWLKGSFTPDTILIIGTMSDPTDLSSFKVWDTVEVTSGYVNKRVNFDTYTGSDTYIAFLYNPTVSFRSISLDEICYEAIPSCEKTPSVAVLNAGIDSTFLSLGWNVDTNQVSHIIAYGPAGYDPITNPTGGNMVTTTGSNFYTVNNLQPLTEYCFWVKAVCKNGDSSVWAGPYCAETGCPASNPVPYFEDFTSLTSVYPTGLPLCWEEGKGELGVSSSSIAIMNSNWTSDGFSNASATGAAKMNLYLDGQSEWLISPRFDLGSDMTVSQKVEFDIAMTDWNNSNQGVVGEFDSLAFLMSTDGGVTWNHSSIIEVWDTSNVPSSSGDHFSYTLSRGLGVVQFAFYCGADSATEDNDWFIDNFRISDTTYAGVNENSFAEAKFKVYPNPNTGVFNVLNEGNSIQSSIKVMDIQGRVVLDESYYFNTRSSKRIDLSNNNAGVYILVLQSGDKIEQHRIIINK